MKIAADYFRLVKLILSQIKQRKSRENQRVGDFPVHDQFIGLGDRTEFDDDAFVFVEGGFLCFLAVNS